jgi:hypothetical protein
MCSGIIPEGSADGRRLFSRQRRVGDNCECQPESMRNKPKASSHFPECPEVNELETETAHEEQRESEDLAVNVLLLRRPGWEETDDGSGNPCDEKRPVAIAGNHPIQL